MKRIVFMSLSFGIFAVAMGMASFNSTFKAKYDAKSGSVIAKANCGLCHAKSTGGKLNPYGKDLQVAMKAEGAKKLTAAALAKVEGLDSDQDGKKNVDEIKADTLPGSK